MPVNRRQFIRSTGAAMGILLIPQWAEAAGDSAYDSPEIATIRPQGVIDIAATPDRAAILYAGTPPQLVIIDRRSGVSEIVQLPTDLITRCVAAIDGRFAVGGALETVYDTYESSFGDYFSEQPADLIDEPGVADWVNGDDQKVEVPSYEPAVYTVDRSPRRVDVFGDRGPQYGGQVSAIIDGFGSGVQLFVEETFAPGAIEGFNLCMATTPKLESRGIENRMFVPRVGPYPHESVVAVSYSRRAARATAVLASSGRVRFATIDSKNTLTMSAGPQLELGATVLGLTTDPALTLVVANEGKPAMTVTKTADQWVEESATTVELAAAADTSVVLRLEE